MMSKLQGKYIVILLRETQKKIHALINDMGILEYNLSKYEDAGPSSPRILSRRKVLRVLHNAIVRQKHKYFLCPWGCGQFLQQYSRYKKLHESAHCPKRITFCELGCCAKFTELEWNESIIAKDGNETIMLLRRAWHEKNECPRRMVLCPQQCGVFVAIGDLSLHLTNHCPKRESQKIKCPLGCGYNFFEGYGTDMGRTLKDHEKLCPHRFITCNWINCNKRVKAIDMFKHTREHVNTQRIITFNKAGLYMYQIPKLCNKIQIKVWGAGGGGGISKNRAGNGGGGAFVKGVLNVSRSQTLQLCVGDGGEGAYKIKQTEDKSFICRGGEPGGGNGHVASGGGGGYSIVQHLIDAHSIEKQLQSPTEFQPLLVAGGGGGGGSYDGFAGIAYNEGSYVNDINGQSGSLSCGGLGGKSSGHGCCYILSQDGSYWKGGNGSAFAAGGGGGLFGGGGGGTMPGINGGGGGGSSYADDSFLDEIVMVGGNERLPGSVKCDTTRSTIYSNDNMNDSQQYGEGGRGDNKSADNGRPGCIEIRLDSFSQN